nr:RNA-directed DNA polymerase, eukaryota [Tanacetum cinerariifolium]
MGSYRSKEDDVAKISTTVFVTYFPESLSAKELFHSCKTYGHVVDSFIPTKRGKNGKRFGFVRFINVFSEERLVDNLCTVWIDRCKLHANVSRFNRNSTNGAKVDVKGTDGRMNREEDRMMSPAVVLDDGCLMTRDLSKSILGRVKEFASLANLKMALCNEDASLEFYTDKRIAWVEVEGILFKMWSGNMFNRIAAKWGDLLDVDDQEDTCFHSKRLCVHTKLDRSISEVFKIIHAGKVYWIRAKETPGWVPDFAEEYDDEDQDGFNVNDDGPKDQVPRCFGDDNEGEEGQENIVNKIAEKGGNDNKSEGSLKYRSGFSPKVNNEGVSLSGGDAINHDGKVLNTSKQEEGDGISSTHMKLKEEGTHSISFGHFKKFEPPKTGGSILGLLDEVVKVGQVMGYKMEGCLAKKAKKEWVKELCNKNKVNFLTLQETKMETMDMFCVRKCWGNATFDYIHSAAVGNSGGILCIWDSNSFCKESVTMYDSFIMVRGDRKVRLLSWEISMRSSVTMSKTQCKNDLEAIDKIIDSGNRGEVEINKRAEIINKLQEIDNSQSMEIAQKAKIKWAMEGDENSSFFHGMLKMKRNMLNVRGVMIDGVWVDNQERVKQEFFEHFKDRFCQPGLKDASIQMEFPYKLSEENLREVERNVTNDEIKRAVWDCSIDKAQGLTVSPSGSFVGFGILYGLMFSLMSVNGSPTEEFQFDKGLKQGDPLSPFLFILVMESLHLSFQRIVDVGMFHGIKLGEGLVNFSHMFYADDAVFVGQWCNSQITTLVHVLRCFYKASGLHINNCKSKIMGVHVDGDTVNRAAGKLGCMVLNTPFSYLGSIVGGNMSRIQMWKDIVDRDKKRLSKWRMQTLSIGGRLTLVKSVLGSMPLYYFSTFKVPMAILHELEGIRGHFFNGHDNNNKKATWVSWKRVLLPKNRGGLEVSSLYTMNRGLMFKWIWRFFNQCNSLWVRVIKAIHGVGGRIGANSRIGSSSCWTTVIQEINTLLKKGIDLIDYMRIKVGNGESTLFWEDKWCEEGVLRDIFPRVFALEVCKNITVTAKFSQPLLSSSFRRNPRGGREQDQFQTAVDLVTRVSLDSSSDRWIWGLEDTVLTLQPAAVIP